VGQMPLKWLPVEALFQGIFGQASDVWGFGVVVWEFYSYGQTPFGTLRGVEFQERVKAGLRLSKPFNCPENIFAICQECWHARWRERPTFMQLLESLSNVAKQYVQEETRTGIRDLGKLYLLSKEGGEATSVAPERLTAVPRISVVSDDDLAKTPPLTENFVRKIGDLPKFNESGRKVEEGGKEEGKVGQVVRKEEKGGKEKEEAKEEEEEEGQEDDAEAGMSLVAAVERESEKGAKLEEEMEGERGAILQEEMEGERGAILQEDDVDA